ncbi:AraC family transcriptional regulator [Celeribacter sp.]|uniref:AraC family transcriptional regulator n=1 Tax=Celeribacter sp. TaxID=1890673 RepID=UPI003A94B40A
MRPLPIFDTAVVGSRQASEFCVKDWDETSNWLGRNVTPLKLEPTGEIKAPEGAVHYLSTGRIRFTRTSYGARTSVDIEGYSGAPVVATTNIYGHATPALDGQEARVNGPDMSFVFDLSERSHHSELSEDNVQLQMSIDPKALDEISLNWFGHIPHRSTWQSRTSFGGSGTNWHACLHYLLSLVTEAQEPLPCRTVRHIEETACVNLLENWAAQCGVDLGANDHVVVPRVVRMAEDYIVANAADAPTLAEIAAALDISVRNLSMNFKKYRGCTPGQFLRMQRLKVAREELCLGGDGKTVSQIAASLGYIHMGEFAKAYRELFGELPSDTLKRA